MNKVDCCCLSYPSSYTTETGKDPMSLCTTYTRTQLFYSHSASGSELTVPNPPCACVARLRDVDSSTLTSTLTCQSQAHCITHLISNMATFGEHKSNV